MELYKLDKYGKSPVKVGLYDVMEWFVEKYPKDIFVSNHPVHKFRDFAIEKLKRRNHRKMKEENITCFRCGKSDLDKLGQVECNFGCLHWACEDCKNV